MRERLGVFLPAVTVLICFVVSIFILIPPAFSQADLNVDAKSAILVEASTGKVINKKNENEPLPPASMTKMMTEYIILEAINQGRINWDDAVKNTNYGFYLAKKGDSSSIGLGEFEVRTVKELYEAMSIYSANDATVVLAEYLAGSEQNFVKLMNDKAEEFGMENTHFITSTGYPVDDLGSYAPQDQSSHVMSARDSAILARELITTYPEALDFSSIAKLKFRTGESLEREMVNYNWMLQGLISEYQGADGLKTGYTSAAGYSFTGTAERDGVRYISVIMGTGSKLKRFEETRRFFDYAFNNYEMKIVVQKGDTITTAPEAAVRKGIKYTVPTEVAGDLVLPMRKGAEDSFRTQVTYDGLTAPIDKGQALGKLRVEYTDVEEAEFLRPIDAEQLTVDMTAAAEVKKAGWIRLFFRGIKNFVGGLFK